MKFTALTITYRDTDYLRHATEGLTAQRFPHDEFEWIIVDAVHAEREGPFPWDGVDFRVRHIAQTNQSGYRACASAWNDGLAWASGTLVLGVSDYLQLGPDIMRRQWELYERFGPKVAISSHMHQVVDAATGRVDPNREPERNAELQIEPGLGELITMDYFVRWFWCSNDSVPLEAYMATNGWDERNDGRKGGDDAIFGVKVQRMGYRWLLDDVARSARWPYNPHGRPVSATDDLWQKLCQEALSGVIWSPNKRNLPAERARNLGL